MQAVDRYEQDNPATQWHAKLTEVRSKRGLVLPVSGNTLKQRFNADDVGLYSDAGSYIKLSKDGNIDIFGSTSSGMRISPKQDSIAITGKKINIYADEIDINVPVNKFKINHQPIIMNLLPLSNQPKIGSPHSAKFKQMVGDLR